MFCTFIFAVLLLFLLVISYKDIALQIFFTVAKPITTVTEL